MTGYKSKRAAAQSKLVVTDIDGHVVRDARKPKKAQPAQEPVALVIDGVLVKSALPEKYTGHLYTTPPQRPWQEPTGNEWFEWWRVSQVADATEAEIDFADFLIIAQAVMTKYKELNNG